MELLKQEYENGTLTRKRWQDLLMLEKEQLCNAWNIDPEISKIRYKNSNQWFYDTYGETIDLLNTSNANG